MSLEITIAKVGALVTLDNQYQKMLDSIAKNLPAIRRDSENFYKASSQFKSVTLDVTDITSISSLKHVLAVIDQTRLALEEAYINVKRKEIELEQKKEKHNKEQDLSTKKLLALDILEIENGLKHSESIIKGALRKLSFFTTQYQNLMEHLNLTELTEEDYEKNETRHHVMTAMKQALLAARTRGGVIDEGNHIYLFDMGINGAVAQAEIFAYLQAEEELLKQGKEPTHEMTIKWLEACADKFGQAGIIYAQNRGLLTLDAKSLTKGNHVQKSS